MEDTVFILVISALGILTVFAGKRGFNRISNSENTNSSEKTILRIQLFALEYCILVGLFFMVLNRVFRGFDDLLSDPTFLPFIWIGMGYIAASSYIQKVTILGWLRAESGPTRGRTAQAFGAILFILILGATVRFISQI